MMLSPIHFTAIEPHSEKISNNFMTQIFKQKAPSNQELRNPRGSSPLLQAQPVFPFSNSRLRQKGWEEDCMEVQPYKSRAQLSRKRLESIPLLKNLRL
jgi:hypothetical protein